MSYQIPQQLEYNERIMFGLTFKQLAYAFLFGSVAVILLKSAMPLKYVLALIPSSLGVCFMFFDLDVHLMNYFFFLKFRELRAGNPKLERFISVKKIEDNLVCASQGKKIAILRVQPINFGIKPSDEKELVMESFQKFLNSVDFPIQILMTTESLELDDYLDALRARISDRSFLELFYKYKKHLHSVISSNKIMNRVFYLVIREQNDIDIQVDICLERLENMNLGAERLGNIELRQLLTKFFSGKGQGSLIQALSPDCISNHPRHLRIGGRYYRVIYAHGYPRTVEPGFLDRIVGSVGDFDLSIHIKPYQMETMLIGLNKELQKQKADLYALQSKDVINPSLEIQYSDTRKTLEALQKGKEKLFNISLYITCKADSLRELDLLSRRVESELNSLMIIPRTATFRMMQGFKSTAPLGIDELNANRNITTRALAAFFPFTSQFLEVDESGIWLGLNKNKVPIIRDIFKLPNPNGLVLAQSGGGKSYFCKLLVARYLLNGTKVMIIDPQGEYRELVKHFKGQRIDLARTSKTIINPLDLMGHDYAEKRLSLMDLMQVMLGELTEPQKAFIDRALTEAYNRKGISDDSSTWDYKPPILQDVLEVLIGMEKRAITLERSTIRSLMNRLSMYVDGVFSFLNQHTNINFNNRFVCFDIGDMPKQVKPVIMFLVLDYVYMKMKSDIERKILLIDEAWSLLSRTEDATYIFEIVKTCRKYNLGLLLINQEVEGLLSSEAGKSVLANSSYTLLMRQKPAVINGVCEAFHLSSSERTHLLTANVGEGILIMEDDHTQIRIVASEEEHRIITTNADEIIEQHTTKEKASRKADIAQREVDITLDSSKGFFMYSKLKLDEIKYLLARGYRISTQLSISSGRAERYLLKPRFNENIAHFFLVCDIAEYLRKHTDKIELFETKKPDIVFEINNRKIAVEVETGKSHTHALKQLRRKVELLNDTYDDWFFVVTNKNHASKYSKLGKTFNKRTLAKKIDLLVKDIQNGPQPHSAPRGLGTGNSASTGGLVTKYNKAPQEPRQEGYAWRKS